MKINFNDWNEYNDDKIYKLNKHIFNNLNAGDLLHCYKGGSINIDGIKSRYCIKDLFYEVLYINDYDSISIRDEQGFEHEMSYDFAIRHFDYVKEI